MIWLKPPHRGLRTLLLYRVTGQVRLTLRDLSAHPVNISLARYHSFDKDGAPVYYERIGAVDVRGVVNTIPGEELILFHIYLQEVGRKM